MEDIDVKPDLSNTVYDSIDIKPFESTLIKVEPQNQSEVTENSMEIKPGIPEILLEPQNNIKTELPESFCYELDPLKVESFSHDKVASKKHKCETCVKSFGKVEHLQRHISSVHDGVKNYECEICGKAFSQAGHLKGHKASVHEKIKNHKCETCGKAFGEARHLKRHISSVHEGRKDHNCKGCGKSFSNAGNLKTHIEHMHERVKNHKCDTCDKSFYSKNNLIWHIKTVHK